MTKVEFFVTMKVTCEHDEQGYWGDQTKEQVKETAIQLIQPNFHTVENGIFISTRLQQLCQARDEASCHDAHRVVGLLSKQLAIELVAVGDTLV